MKLSFTKKRLKGICLNSGNHVPNEDYIHIFEDLIEKLISISSNNNSGNTFVSISDENILFEAYEQKPTFEKSLEDYKKHHGINSEIDCYKKFHLEEWKLEKSDWVPVKALIDIVSLV